MSRVLRIAAALFAAGAAPAATQTYLSPSGVFTLPSTTTLPDGVMQA